MRASSRQCGCGAVFTVDLEKKGRPFVKCERCRDIRRAQRVDPTTWEQRNATVTTIGRPEFVVEDPASRIYGRALREMEAAGVADTSAAAVVLSIAARLDSNAIDTGSAVSALQKSFSLAMDRALGASVKQQGDVIDGIFGTG